MSQSNSPKVILSVLFKIYLSFFKKNFFKKKDYSGRHLVGV